MAHSFSESFPGSPRDDAPIPRQVGGWKLLLAAMAAAAGLGFAGYVYAVPYQTLSRLASAQAAELEEEKASHAVAIAEREKVRADLGQHLSTAQQKAEAAARHRQSVAALAVDLKTALGAVGATVSISDKGNIEVTLPADAIFEQPFGTGVSGQGETTLRILGAAVQKSDSRITFRARLIAAPSPHGISQFKNIGEFAMLRAVRAALAVASTGVNPASVAAAGAPPPEGRKGKPAAIPDLLEVEIERE